MATHSSILAWRIPGTEEPNGLLSMGSHRVRHDWSDLAAAAASWAKSLLLRCPWSWEVLLLGCGPAVAWRPCILLNAQTCWGLLQGPLTLMVSDHIARMWGYSCDWSLENAAGQPYRKCSFITVALLWLVDSIVFSSPMSETSYYFWACPLKAKWNFTLNKKRWLNKGKGGMK